jgi:hypothetical protein
MKKIVSLASIIVAASLSSCTYNTYDVKPVRPVYTEPVKKAPVGGVSGGAEDFRAIEKPASYSY